MPMASVRELKEEKAKLEKRLSDIQVELSKHGEESTSKYSSTTGKASYLYKWQDRAIGWGGTKWGLRYVVLKGGGKQKMDSEGLYYLRLLCVCTHFLYHWENKSCLISKTMMMPFDMLQGIKLR
jgi:hypothetical protein